jgi:hypothetical protein
MMGKEVTAYNPLRAILQTHQGGNDLCGLKIVGGSLLPRPD